MSDMNDTEARVYSIEQAAELLSLSPWTVRKWIAERKITSCKLGSRRAIPVTEIGRLINESLDCRDDER